MQTNVLVIGASGGIAQALLQKLNADPHTDNIISVSRSELSTLSDKHEHRVLDSNDESQIKAFVDEQKKRFKFQHIICCTGVLHSFHDAEGKESATSLKPEKRLEDMNAEQFAQYFKINTIVPAMWVKHAVHLVDKAGANIVVFSARVGSISENGLGGWYGYRASKAALNMVMKTAAVEYKRRASNTVLVCYHPGTVDTELSKPFQANVKPEKLFTPEFTVEQLIKHTMNLDSEHSPYFIDWDGQSINW